MSIVNPSARLWLEMATSARQISEKEQNSSVRLLRQADEVRRTDEWNKIYSIRLSVFSPLFTFHNQIRFPPKKQKPNFSSSFFMLLSSAATAAWGGADPWNATCHSTSCQNGCHPIHQFFFAGQYNPSERDVQAMEEYSVLNS